MTVLSLPSEGKPKEFNNLVGDFELTLTAEPHEVTLNEPVSVEMIISGTGNFDAVTPPSITDPNSWKVYPARRYHVQSSENATDGASRSIGFSQVIIPKRKLDAIPPFELSYFSPRKKQYVTLRSSAIPITVKMPTQSVEPPPATVATSGANKAAPHPDDKVPQVKPNITDILAIVPEKPTWLAVRPAPWADQRFLTVNLIAAGVLALLVLGKLGIIAWRAHAASPLAPTRKLWRQLQSAHVSRGRFYRLAASYISARGLSGERAQQVLNRHNEVNFGPPNGEADATVPHDERNKVLEALQP